MYIKKRLNEILKNEEYDQLEYFTYKLDYLIPIALASSMTPDYNFRNEIFNLSNDPNIVYEHVNFIIQPTKTNKTLIIFSCLPEHEKAIKFLDQLNDMPEFMLLKTFTSLAIGYVENTFLSPSIWNKLYKNEKKILMDELKITNPMERGINGKMFKSKLNLFDPRFKK